MKRERKKEKEKKKDLDWFLCLMAYQPSGVIQY